MAHKDQTTKVSEGKLPVNIVSQPPNLSNHPSRTTKMHEEKALANTHKLPRSLLITMQCMHDMPKHSVLASTEDYNIICRGKMMYVRSMHRLREPGNTTMFINLTEVDRKNFGRNN